jgi:hypothetical protein
LILEYLVKVGNGLAVPFDAMPGNVPIFGPNPNPSRVFPPRLVDSYPKQNPAFIGALPSGFAE